LTALADFLPDARFRRRSGISGRVMHGLFATITSESNAILPAL
jgi:hypothetical protein